VPVTMGDPAPGFTLPGTDGTPEGHRDYSLQDYRDRAVVLVFYPADNSPVCTVQLNTYSDDISRFADSGAQVLAISPQSVDEHDQWAASQGGFAFPLLADIDKSVGEAYGILGPVGFYRRSVFVVDPAGVIRYAHRSTAGLTFRPVAEIVDAVQAMVWARDPRTRSGRAKRSTRWMLVVVPVAMTLIGCVVMPLDVSLGALALTSEPPDTIGIDVNGELTIARASTKNTGANTRVAFWQKESAKSMNQQTCATWTRESDPFNQEGAALRMRTVAGVTRGITITKNIYGSATWVFNVHVWDTSGPSSPLPATQIAQFDLSSALVEGFQLRPLPWRICARAVDDVVSFKVWPADEIEPGWASWNHVRAVRLPPGWLGAGTPGWYVAHLRPGEAVRFGELFADELSPQATAGSRSAASVIVPVDPEPVPGLP
jgi:peroxiredoxin Q/BCP